MKKINKIRIISLIVILAVMLTACGGNSGNSDSGTEKDVYKIRVGHTLQETTPSHVMFSEGFKKYVEEESDGRIEVEIYANSSLGGERQMAESTQIGTLEIAYLTTAVLANFDPKFQVFDLPFLFDDIDIARKAIDGELGDIVGEDLENDKMKLLSYAENGYRMISNNRGPIHTPEDLEGIKIRTMENPIHMETFRQLGASPTPMAFTELYTALQQGTVDAQENPIFITHTSKFAEVQDYLTLSGHVYAPGVAVISLEFWESLPADLQEIVQEGMFIARDMQRDLLDKENDEHLEELKETMEVNELTAEEKELFVEATKPVYDKLAEELSQELIDIAIEANETYK